MKHRLLLLLFSGMFGLMYHNSDAFSFDNAFPLTSWYEKGLNTAIMTWYAIDTTENIDIIIGKCAFAYFCLEKMVDDKQAVIDEDIDYFKSCIQALEQKIAHCYDNSSQQHDQRECLEHILLSMKKCLQIPANIKTK